VCASHLPVLTRAFTLSKGDVLELGTGVYSTTILKWLCELDGRTLHSYENSLRWFRKMAKNPVQCQKLNFVIDWDKIDIERKWGLAFVDHSSNKRRWLEIKRLAKFAEYIVIHDTNPEYRREYRYYRIWPLFKYRYDFKKYSSHTSVVSNFFKLDKFNL